MFDKVFNEIFSKLIVLYLTSKLYKYRLLKQAISIFSAIFLNIFSVYCKFVEVLSVKFPYLGSKQAIYNWTD